MVKTKLKIVLSTNSEEPKKESILAMIVGEKLKKIMGPSEDLRAETKSKNKERSTVARFEAITRG